MKVKLLLVVVFLAIAVALGFKTASQNLSQSGSRQLRELEEKEKRGSITRKERVELAKRRGKKEINVPGFVSLQPVAQSPEELEALLPRFSVILAEVVEQFGYLSDSRSIMSWYKFRTIDVITQAPPRQSFVERQIPDQLRQLKDGEFLVPLPGGTAIVDGIEVIQNDQTMPHFKKSQKYLLLLSLNPVTRIAELALGPQSMLPVNADGSFDTKMNPHLLQQTIMKFHNGSIDQLKRNML